jgi:hypothetical protein
MGITLEIPWLNPMEHPPLRNYMTGSSQEHVDPEVLRKAVKHMVKFSEIRDAGTAGTCPCQTHGIYIEKTMEHPWKPWDLQ